MRGLLTALHRDFIDLRKTAAWALIAAFLVCFWSAVCPGALVVKYLCDDNAASTTVTDSSGNAFHGTASANTDTMDATDIWGNACFNFNGTSHYITIPDISASLGNSGTLCFWAKYNTRYKTSVGIGLTDFGETAAILTEVMPFTDMQFYSTPFRGSGASTMSRVGPFQPIDMDLKTWTHHAWVTAPGANGWKYYQNGQLVTQATGHATVFYSATFEIGRSHNAIYFPGAVGDIRVYNDAKSATDISAIMAERLPADTMYVFEPQENEIIQRSGTTASIAWKALFSGTRTNIEADYAGGGYTNGTVSGQIATGTLTSQPQGEGTLTIRDEDETTVNDTVGLGIGDKFLIEGQSNAVGNATNNQSYSHGSLHARVLDKNGQWRDCTDPTDWLGTGSAWPLLATDIMAAESIPVGFVTMAVGGSTISAITAHNAVGYNFLRAGGGTSCAAVIYLQGETDAIAGTAEATYETALNTIVNTNKSTTGAGTLVCQIAWNSTSTDAQEDTIRKAQLDVINSNADAYFGGIIYPSTLGDNLHAKTNGEIGYFEDMIYLGVDELLYGGTAGTPALVASAEMTDSDTMRITFDKAITTDTTYTTAAFTFSNNGTPIAASSASQVDDSPVGIVDVNLASAAGSTGLTATLGSGDNAAGGDVPLNAGGLPAQSMSFSVEGLSSINPLSSTLGPGKDYLSKILGP